MEIWKSIKDYEGYYEVSNLGNVRSIPHKVRAKGGFRTSPGCILVQKTTKKFGRKQVALSKGGKVKWISVHRLVAFAFCDGWFIGAVVNHKDENPTNNNAENLEWCTQSYNCSYGHHNDRNRALLSIPIKAYDKNNNTAQNFTSIREASRMTGVSATHICSCCKGKRKSAGGFVWKYDDDEVGFYEFKNTTGNEERVYRG